MGVVVPNFASSTEDRASGAQVIDGSLNFNQISEPCLTRSLGSSGNRSTWTVSLWAKLTPNATTYNSLFMGTTDGMQWEYETLMYSNGNLYYIDYISQAGGVNVQVRTNDNFRDSGGWYHIVLQKVSNAGGIKLYVNNRLLDSFSSNINNGGQSSHWNTTGATQSIGNDPGGQSTPNSQMSQFYFIDGQALTPDSFGYTDGLTNTWRPKKYEGTFGTNGFYLPMDGNSPIGEDKSGKGNNWTPSGFGGSVALDKPIVSGARPILNTTAGVVARPGVFGSEVGFRDTVSSSSGGGNPYIFDTNGTRPTFNFIRGATYVFDYSSATSHPLRFATAADAAGSTEYTDGTSVSGNVISFTVPHNAPNTLYYYCTNHGGMGSSISITTDETKADPYAWKNVLALPLVGSANDVSNSVNSGSTTKTATPSGALASSAASNFYNGSFLFDGSNDYIAVTDNADLAFGTGDLTVELWVYPNTLVSNDVLYDSRQSTGGATTGFSIIVNNTGMVSTYTAGGYRCQSTSLLKVGKWSHIAVVRSSGTDTLFIDGIAQADTDTTNGNYTDQKCRIGSDVNGAEAWGGHISDFRLYNGVAKYTSNFVVPATSPDILPDTPSGMSGSSKLAKITDGAVSFDGTGDYLVVEHSDMAMGTGDFTVECFVYNKTNKNYNAFISTRETSNGTTAGFVIASDAAGDLYVHSGAAMAGNYSGDLILPLNQWCHVAYTRSSGTHRLFLNGVAAANSTTTSRDYTEDMLVIGDNGYAKDEPIDGFISNVRVIKGTALYTANFTPPTRELTNVTNTKLLCCQSNTSVTEGAVKPGTITAGGNAAATNFNPFNTDINTVRGQETGYATWNPLDKSTNTTLSDGNLNFKSSSGWSESKSTIKIPTTGKWYVEQIYRGGSSNLSPSTWNARYSYFGVCTNNYVFGNSGGDNCLVLSDTNFISKFGTQTAASGAVTKGPGGTVSLALNRDDNTYEFFYQGVSIDSGTIGTTDSELFFMVGHYPGNTTSFDFNFGQKPFKFPPPAGFQPLNAANVRPDTVFARPDQFVSATLYTGDASTSRLITGLNFNDKPDLIWIKNRDETIDHTLYDSVRGFGANKELTPNNTFTEGDTGGGKPNTDVWGYVNSNNINGFTVNKGSNSTPSVVNGNGINYVAWCWKAGGNKNTFNVDDVGYASAAAAGLTGGSLAVTGASVGTKQGFSIIKFASGSSGNKTLSHGLLETPTFILVKTTGATSDWSVYHKDLGGTVNNYLVLNSAATNATSSNIWGDAVPTSSVFGINPGTTCATNQDVIAYLWHDVPGLQKFGKWTNNNSNNGTFTELGFRPAILLLKDIDGGEQWYIIDSKRQTFNIPAPSSNGAAAVRTLQPSSANSEATADNSHTNTTVDFLSNGFKIYTTNPASGEISYGTRNYIYAAWAEAPVSGLYGAQSNAR